MKWYWPVIFATIAIVVLSPSVVAAQEPVVQVSSSGAYPLVIDGIEVTEFPAEVPVGTTVCASDNPDHLPVYLSNVERINFLRWSHGPTDLCTTFNEPGNFTAIHGVEVQLIINSEVRAERVSKWVTRGESTPLTVPEQVDESPGVRYLFEEWTAGEDRFSPQNSIVPTQNLSLEVKWTKQYFLELVGPADVSLSGQGWHTAGGNVVIEAEATSPEIDIDTRFEFRDWEDLSDPAFIIPNQGRAFQTTIAMNNTYKIRANFHITFHVKVVNPDQELRNVWAPEGESVSVETPQNIEREAEKERLSFKGWEGADIELAKDTLIVTGPMNVKAIYESQFKVSVEAQFGVTSGDGWYAEGEVATIKVPEFPSALFFMNRSFSGFDGYSTDGPVLELEVTEAVTVTATYQTTVDFRLLGLIIAGLVVVGIIYLITQREYNRRRRVVRW